MKDYPIVSSILVVIIFITAIIAVIKYEWQSYMNKSDAFYSDSLLVVCSCNWKRCHC